MAATPSDETARLRALFRYRILDTPPDQVFDDLAKLTAFICGTSVAVIGFVDRDRQWFKAKVGLDAAEIKRSLAVCSQTILGTDLFAVPDARADRRFSSNPLVVGQPYIRFYGGVPILTDDGYAIGTLAVMDPTPRTLTVEQRMALRTLATQVMTLLKVRMPHEASGRAESARMSGGADMRSEQAGADAGVDDPSLQEIHLALSHAMPGISRLDDQGRYVAVNDIYAHTLGYEPQELIGHVWEPTVHPDDRPAVIQSYERMKALGRDEFEARAVRKDGSLFYKQVLMVQILDRDGRFMGHHCFMRDITERKAAEEALRESERRLKELLETVRLMAVINDLEGQVLYCNPYFLAVTGYENAEVLGCDYIDTFIPGEWRSLLRTTFLSAMKHAAFPRQFENEVITRAGVRRLISWTNTPLRSAGGQVIGMASLGVDITERKQAEGALRASEERFRAAYHNASVGMSICDLTGRLLEVNRALCDILGYSEGELLTRDFQSLTHPDDIAENLDRIRALVEGAPVPQVFMKRYIRKDGGFVWVQVGLSVIRNSEGTPRHLLAMVQDISERKKADELLRVSEERFRLVAEATNDILRDWDIQTDTHWMSPNAREKFGYDSQADCTIKAWSSRVHPDDRERILGLVEKAVRSGRRTVSWKYRFRLADGSYGHFYDRAQILRNASGRAIRMIGAMIDVTESTRAYVSLEDAYRRLQAMSHELQTVESNERRRLSRELHDEVGQLLSSLKFDLESVRRGGFGRRKTPPAQIAERLTRALETTDLIFTRLRQIVRALRPPVLEELGLKAALEALTADVQTRTGLACSLVFQKETEHVARLPTCETALYRIAQELLTNVVRHARATTVSVQLSAAEQHWILMVKDNGVGCDSTTLASSGGVGLRGIRERAEILGGRVELASRPGSGTSVIVRIPVRPEPTPRPAKVRRAAPASRRRQEGHD